MALPSEKQQATSTSAPGLSSILSRFGETPRQVGMLFSAHLGSMFSGLMANLLLAGLLEKDEMGRFAFGQSVIVIAALFFEVGLFSAGSRVLALARDAEEQRKALGALVLMSLAIGIVFALSILAAAGPIDMIFESNVRDLLLVGALFAFFQPFQLLMEMVCQGMNRIRRLSLFQLGMSVTYLLLLVIVALTSQLTAPRVLACYLAGIGVSATWTIARLKPRFTGSGRYFGTTMREARGYGLNIYVARLTGVLASRFDSLLIAYMAGFGPLGLYAIVQRLSNSAITLPRALAITRFRAFAHLDRVPSRILRWNAVVMAGLSISLAVGGPILLRTAFPKYAEATTLLIPFALLSFFVGLFQPYNAFLSSHGRGAELRNVAIVATAASLTGLVLLLPRYGVAGAAWAGAMAMALDYLLHLHYYHKLIRQIESSAGTPTANDATPQSENLSAQA